MKYSKQRLATAMAATMVVSMVPAMAFAAPADVDNVVKLLNSSTHPEPTQRGLEDVAETAKGNFASAEAALAAAKVKVNGDQRAELIVKAYEASLNMLKATTKAEFDKAEKDFKELVPQLMFLNAEHKDNVNQSFKSATTMKNHADKKATLEAPAPAPTEVKATYAAFDNPILGVAVLEVTLENAKAADVTAVKVNGKEVKKADFSAALEDDGTTPKEKVLAVTTEEKKKEDVTKVELVVNGKTIEAMK